MIRGLFSFKLASCEVLWASYLGSPSGLGIFILADLYDCPLPLCEWPIRPLLFLLSGVAGSLNNTMSFILSQLTMIFLSLLAHIMTPNVRAQVTFVPPAIPLAVRSPYLNCWLINGTGALFGQTWPTTFNHSQVCRT